MDANANPAELLTVHSRAFITGIPRSGTTLFASLLDALPHCVCLNEPERYYSWLNTVPTPEAFVAACLEDLNHTAAELRRGQPIFDRRLRDGRIPTNYVSDSGERSALWISPVRRRDGVALVAVKHNEPFVSVLSALSSLPTDVPIVAVVRNPCDTLRSWRRAGLPLSRGAFSSGYRFWPEAHAVRETGSSLEEFHVQLYELYATRLLESRDRIRVVRYEELVADPNIVARVVGRPSVAAAVLASRNGLRRSGDFLAWKNHIAPIVRSHFKSAYELYPQWDAA